jgi:hypothetical protein
VTTGIILRLYSVQQAVQMIDWGYLRDTEVFCNIEYWQLLLGHVYAGVITTDCCYTVTNMQVNS